MVKNSRKVRKFRKSDAEACSKIISICINKNKDLTKKAKNNISTTSTPEALIKRMKKRQYFVYEKNGKILGIGALNKNQIRTMYVLPKLQGKCIGTQILKRIEREARKRKHKKLFLYSHPLAHKFYKKQGFETIKKYRDKGMDVVFMEKKLR